MQILNNILRSGHVFSENEGLQKFRFGILNIFILLPAIPTILNILSSYFGAIDSGTVFETALILFILALGSSFYILRKDKKFYTLVVSLYIASTLILFYFVIFTRREDEFRLIALFMAAFMTYVLVGKMPGMVLSLFIAASVLFISKNFDLGFSSYAYFTFFTFFPVFCILLYCFLEKIERDALEFKILHKRLEDKVEHETSQRMAQEQMLLRRSRLANMGEMMDSIAHQWRQPLMHINSILLNMESAIETTKNERDKDYLKNKLDEVATLTSHMSQTIEDFRGLFKVEKEYTNFSIKEVIDEVLLLLKNNLNDIELDFHNEHDVSVLGNRSELMQVFIIILSNSIDALKSREISNKKITIDISSSENRLCVDIEDNAGGIKSDNADVIFDPYFTTKKQSGGTGLGLYIAKIIVVHNMAGDISVVNTSNGAKFSISLAQGTVDKSSNIT